MKILKLIALIGIPSLFVAVVACNDARVASYNLSKASDNFEIHRRVVFYNGITNDYMLEIQGLCSLEPIGRRTAARLAVTCKTGDDTYKKHFLGLSDNVTYFSEQIESEHVSAYHYRVTFKPQTILPDVDFRGSTTDLTNDQR